MKIINLTYHLQTLIDVIPFKSRIYQIIQFNVAKKSVKKINLHLRAIGSLVLVLLQYHHLRYMIEHRSFLFLFRNKKKSISTE